MSGKTVARTVLPLFLTYEVISQHCFSESFAGNHVIIFICIAISKEQVMNFCLKAQRMSMTG